MKLVLHNSWPKWMLLAALALSTTYGAGQPAVRLRDASVSRDSILLSDLLPPEASTAMRRAGEQIDLGRTPQCHTIRFFDPSDIERRTSSWPALQRLVFAGPISVQRACFPIRREAVEKVISEFAQQEEIAPPVSPIRWPELIFASQESPALEVEQALPDPARPQLQIRLRCVQPAVCPSFWVEVPTRQRLHLLSAPAPEVKSAPGPSLVKSGQRVLLVFDDPPMHIQLLVTCLQRGSLGKQVRAMDPSTHRVYQAEVTGAGTLRAHL
ncbi:MAG: flagella basal body P-ring formation protein FlgA [Terriglobales bacterium]